MWELTPTQLAVFERLRDRGFQFAAFPYYERHIGVKKANCAALLEPLAGAGMRVVGQAGYLVEGNLSVRVTRQGQTWFVWKQHQVAATPERLAELDRFAEELAELLAARA